MLGPVGHRYAVVPEGAVANIGGDARAVYATVCGEEGLSRLAVPQGLIASGREISATAGCFEGQHLAGWRVVGVPQGSVANVGGDRRPVYAFSCCPLPGSGSYQSGSSALSGSGLQSSTTHSSATSSTTSQASQTSGSGSGNSGSGSGSSSGNSGSGSASLIVTGCCPAGLPTIVHVVVTTAPCGLSGTYPCYIDPATIGTTLVSWKSDIYSAMGSPIGSSSCANATTLQFGVSCFDLGNGSYEIQIGVTYCGQTVTGVPVGWNCSPFRAPTSGTLGITVQGNNFCNGGLFGVVATS